jgi:hypothetical protein
MGFFALFAGLAAVAAQAAQPAQSPPPADSATVEGVVVQAQKPIRGDLQQGVLSLQPSFFVKVRPSTALDMMQWLPGFTFQDTRDVRGLEGSGGNVLIDGKPPTSKTDTLQSILRRIPAEQIERVDIISGGAPGIDMHGWPVIANVILKKDANRRKTVTVANTVDMDGHDAPTVALNSSTKDDQRTVEVSLDAGENLNINDALGEGPWTRIDGAGNVLFRANPRAVGIGPYATGSGAYDQALAGGRLRFNGSARYYGTTYSEHDNLQSGPDQGFGHTQTYEQGELGAAYEHPLGKQLTLETQVLERLTHYIADNTLTRPPEPSFLDKHQDEAETVGRATVRYKPSDSFSLEGAAEGAFNTAATRSRETLSGQALTLPESNVNLREQRGDAGVTATWKPNAQLSMEAAFKVEHSTLTGHGDAPVDRGFDYAKPRAVISWAPDKNSQIRLHVEHEADQIAFGYFVAGSNFINGAITAGNAQIRPSQDWLTELVLERKFWATGDLSLTLRHKDLADQIDIAPFALAPGSYVGILQNIGNGYQNDVSVNFLVPLGRLGLSGATFKTILTWTDAQVIDPVTGQKRMPSGQPGFQGEIHFAEDLPQWKLNVGVDAYGAGSNVNYTPFGDQSQGPWVQFAPYAEYRPTAAWSIRVTAAGLPGQRMHQVIDAYTILKGSSPLLYRDIQDFGTPTTVNIRVRRQFF